MARYLHGSRSVLDLLLGKSSEEVEERLSIDVSIDPLCWLRVRWWWWCW